MNVLVLPLLYTSSKLTGISTVNMYLDLIRLINRQRDDISWWLGVPETSEYIKTSYSEGDPALINVIRAPVLPSAGAESRYQDGWSGVDHPFFGRKCYPLFASKRYQMFDVVLSSYYTCQFIPTFQAAYGSKTFYMDPKIGMPAVVNFASEGSLDNKLPKLETKVGQLLLAASVVSSAVTVVYTEADRNELNRLLSIFMSPVKRRESTVLVRTPPVDRAKIPSFRDGPPDKCVFFHGGSLEGKRNLPWMVKQVKLIEGMGLPVKFVIATQWERKPDWANVSCVEFYPLVDRKKFIELLELGTVSLCNVVPYEGTGFSYTEATLSGMIPIIRKRPWNEGRYPAGYEFAVDTENDFAASMLMCAQDIGKAWEIGKKAIRHTEAQYREEALARPWIEVLDMAAESRHEETRRVCKGNFLYKLVGEAFAVVGREFEFEELLDEVVLRMKKDLAWLKRYELQIREMLQAYGAIEVGWRGKWRKR